MGEPRGTRTRAAALVVVLLTGVLGALGGPYVPASAVPPAPPCQQTFGGAVGGPLSWGREFTIRAGIPPDGPVRVTRVELAVAMDVDEGEVRMEWGSFGQRQPLGSSRLSGGGPSVDITFDNLSGAGTWPDNARTGRFSPQSVPSSIFRSGPVRDISVWIESYGQSTGYLRYLSATVTYEGCDPDRDGLPNEIDNCPTVLNRDQADLDGDGWGDACDPDVDGDGVANAGDNCPSAANASQLDWDADGRGNACDDTPGTAPAPPVTPPPVTPQPLPQPQSQTQPPAPGCTASCAYPRTVGLKLQEKKRRLTGAVTSTSNQCTAQVPVTLWQQRRKADLRLVVTTTRRNGTFRTSAPRRAGRYYVTVGSAAEPLCGADRSRTIRVKRR